MNKWMNRLFLSNWFCIGYPRVNVHNDLVMALKDAIDSLEYVQKHLPRTTGWAVRYERIAKGKAILKKHGIE